MSELAKVKQEIIDIVEGEGVVTFCTSWICRKLNQIRATRFEVALLEPIVDLVLQSMVDDGTLEHEGNDIYIYICTTSKPESETEPTVPPVVNIYNTFNITVNFISNNTDSSDNSVKIRKGK